MQAATLAILPKDLKVRFSLSYIWRPGRFLGMFAEGTKAYRAGLEEECLVVNGAKAEESLGCADVGHREGDQELGLPAPERQGPQRRLEPVPHLR